MAEPTIEKADHVIVWEYDHDCVTQRVECRAASDADCRLYCDEDCETVGGIEHRADGSVWHDASDYSEREPQWHRMAVMKDDCNVALFINETGCAAEMSQAGVGRFTLAVTPITASWDGDVYEWAPLSAPPTAGGG